MNRLTHLCILHIFLGVALSTLASCRGVSSTPSQGVSSANSPSQRSIMAAMRSTNPGAPPPVMREFRAAWVATVGNIDWPTKPGLTTEEQQREAIRILDKAAEINLNAIVLQVRTTADALYDSKLEPWSYFLTGQQGRAPEPYYDPLTFWIDEAHKRGIELHAWFNPYRTRYGGRNVSAADSHVSKARPGLVRDYGKVSWMDPGEPESAEHSYRVFMDVVERYDVDGIHIDDYFYPYPEAGPDGVEMPFPDDVSYAKYQQAGGKLGRNDWRRANINALVRRIYEGTKQRKRHVQFGISPFGIPRPGLEGIEYVAGFDQYEKLYADTVLWLHNGWCDYFVPQLYWAAGAPQQPYLGLLQWWTQHNPKGRHLYAGLYTSRINDTPKTWYPQEILGQVMTKRLVPGAHGEVHFSMAALVQNRKQMADLLRDGLYSEPALPPAATWLDAKPPAPPTQLELSSLAPPASATSQPSTRPASVRISWNVAANSEPVWVWVVQYKAGKSWRTKVVPGRRTEVMLEPPGDDSISQVAISAVDRTGNQSSVQIISSGQ